MIIEMFGSMVKTEKRVDQKPKRKRMDRKIISGVSKLKIHFERAVMDINSSVVSPFLRVVNGSGMESLNQFEKMGH